MTAHQIGYINAVRKNLIGYEEDGEGNVRVTHLVDGEPETYLVDHYGSRTKLPQEIENDDTMRPV